jgi:immune inhibitor A
MYIQTSAVYGTLQPYTAQYWEYGITPLGKEVNFITNGDIESGVPAHSGDNEWYGGMGNWAWRTLKQTFSVLPTGATLKFWTYYEIEEDWDYAYVEVYDQTANLWTTLPGTGTTNTLPYDQDNPNTPANRDPMDYFAAGEWNALTGFSSEYIEVTMNLDRFAGHTIDLYFVYWTDAAYNDQGIYIDDISITGTSFTDNCETEGSWTNNGWSHTDGLEPNNWMTTVIDVTRVSSYRNDGVKSSLNKGKILNFQPGELLNVWEAVDSTVTIAKKDLSSTHLLVAITWNAAPHVLRADYGIMAY